MTDNGSLFLDTYKHRADIRLQKIGDRIAIILFILKVMTVQPYIVRHVIYIARSGRIGMVADIAPTI